MTTTLDYSQHDWTRSPLRFQRGRFTDRGSRLLISRAGDDRLDVAIASSEALHRPHTPIVSLRFPDPHGVAQRIEVAGRPGRLDVVTPRSRFALVLAETSTLLLGVPAGWSDLLINATATKGEPLAAGGRLASDAANRAIEYGTDARVTCNEITHWTGGLSVRLGIEATAGQAVWLNIGSTGARAAKRPFFADALQHTIAWWERWYKAAPAVDSRWRDAYAQALWTLGSNLVRIRYDPATEVVVPSKAKYMGHWQWDAYFHAVAMRHIDPEAARDQLRVALAHQLDDGMLPDAVFDDRVVSHVAVPHDDRTDARSMERGIPITKPPLTAWAAWKLHQVAPDRSFLAEVYEPILRSQEWWFEHSAVRPGGLPVYLHPYSSGADDSPLWDLGMPVQAPDLVAYLIVQYDHLAEIAVALDRLDDAQRWRAAAVRLTRRLVRLRWDEAEGLFVAMHGRRRVPTATVLGLMPLLTGRLPPRIARRLVRTLCDNGRFWTRYPVPTVAADDPRFSPDVMWRGPVWMFTNYLLTDGLLRSGFPAVAERLRERTLAMVAAQPQIGEYYNPLTGECPPEAVASFAGSAALFVDLAIARAQRRRR